MLQKSISNWINLIGILGIVFGITGITNSISLLFISKMLGMQEMWNVSPAYIGAIGILINAIYLMAGIFFLMKKSFSLNMMYIVLSLSFLYGLRTIPFLTQMNLFAFLGPLIDAALLMGVYRISKYYYKTPDELNELFREHSKRKSLTQPQMKILAFVGLLSISIPLLIFGLWKRAINLGSTHTDSVEIFHTYFPSFLQGRYDTIYLSLIFCVLAIIFSSICLKLSGIFWKSLNVIILIVSILMLLLNLFGLM